MIDVIIAVTIGYAMQLVKQYEYIFYKSGKIQNKEFNATIKEMNEKQVIIMPK